MPQSSRRGAGLTDSELLTTGQAAAALGVRSVNTVKQWVRQGTLEGFRRGSRVLVLKESVARLQKEDRIKPDKGDHRTSRGRQGQSQDVLSDLRKLPAEVDRAERMRILDSTAAEIKRRAAPSLRSHGISRAFLFGSAARGDFHSRSDIDIAVELPVDSDLDLIGFVGLRLELEAALGRRVDLVNLATMKPRIRERAIGEQIPLL